MKTSIDCMPCLARQALEAARYVSSDPSFHEGVVRRMLSSLAEIDLNQSPPYTGQQIHRKIRELTGNNDPYRQAKDRLNRIALGLLPELEEKVQNSPDPLKISICLAITGNIIDLGPKSNFTEDDVRLNITRTLSELISLDIDNMRLEIEKASKILYLADNAGEICFDRLLIQKLPAERVILAVRGGPVINDATLQDAYAAGLHKIVRVIDNGSDAPGTILSDCSPEFRDFFNNADLIISKGQGNYESLSELKKNIFFLFRVKCAPVALRTGLEIGTSVLTRTLEL
jgi:hypothetical protein